MNALNDQQVPLTQQAYNLARQALKSAGSISSFNSYASTGSLDSDVVPSYLRFQQKQERTTRSPYHAPAFTLPPKSREAPRSSNVNADVPPRTTTIKLDAHDVPPRTTTIKLDAQLQSTDGSKKTTTTHRPLPYNSNIHSTTFIDPRLTITSTNMIEPAATTTAATTTTTTSTKPPIVPKPSLLHLDHSRKITGGCISSACPPSELDTIIKNSIHSPSPNQYNVSKLVRNGGKTQSTAYTFSSKTPARSFTTTINRNRPGKSPYLTTPGPGHYYHPEESNNKVVQRNVDKNNTVPTDRFALSGSELLDSLESSLRDIQYEDLDVPMEWRLRTGHCIDVAERDTTSTPSSSVPCHVDCTTYLTEKDGAVGRDGRLGRSERRSTPSSSFHRPNQQKAIARRPLHLGIFERLAKNANVKHERVLQCNNAMDRVGKKELRKKKKRVRAIRSRMTQRSGEMRMVDTMKHRQRTTGINRR
jgi:hypothetical protein